MKLNGWQRLWIVVSTIYLVVLALFVIANFPTPGKILHRDQFYDELPNESLSRLVRLSAGRGFFDELFFKDVPPPGSPGRSYAYELFCNELPNIVFATNNHKLCFRNNVAENEKAVIVQQYNQLLRQVARSELLEPV